MDDCARVSVSVPAVPETLPFLRELLGCFASLLGAGEEVVEGIKLAVHEAAANVVEHAYGRDGGTLELEVRAEPELLTVRVADSATTVLANANGKGPQLPPEAAEGGRGLPIIGALADEVELRRSAGTETEMTFALTRTRSC